jgi:hypothetical protein
MRKIMNWFNFVIIAIIVSMFVIITPVTAFENLTQEEVNTIARLLCQDMGEEISSGILTFRNGVKRIEEKENLRFEEVTLTMSLLIRMYTGVLNQIMPYDHKFLDRGDIYEQNHQRVTMLTLFYGRLKTDGDSKKNRRDLFKHCYEMCDIIDQLSPYVRD